MYRWNANATGMERIQNGKGMDTEREFTGTRAERKQNAFCQAFPVRFLLIVLYHIFWQVDTVCFKKLTVSQST